MTAKPPTTAESEAIVADRNPQVMEMVEKELARDPDAKTDALFDRAREIDPSIGDLSLRQFHALYPLPVKRKRPGKRASARRSRKRTPTKQTREPATKRAAAAKRDGSERESVRRIFLDFAGELARAESRASIVEVISRVDDYVDLVMSGKKK